jgi:polyphosphate kinase
MIIKMNALLEPQVILALYQAAQAGVKIELVVRGACAIRPEVPGLSENIHVRSVIGRFLEHTRILYFYNDGAEDVYLSSADWMERNFFGRIEIAFPILEPRLKKRVMSEGLKPYLKDNTQAWRMNANGQYVRRTHGRSKPRTAQCMLLETLAKHA